MTDITDHSPHHAEPAPAVSTASNLVLIDNYDSFTWNIYQYLVLEGANVSVIRNDKITLDELIAKRPTQLVVSPGPGHPKTDSGISREAIGYFAGRVPIFGVCMGQQCILDVYGGDVVFAGEILHGKTSPLSHDGRGIYAGLPQNLPVTRYHSLAGTHDTLPQCLQVTSWVAKADGSKGVIQGVRHKELAIEAVQFHPESILSANGRAMIKNFVRLQGGTWAENERLQKAGGADGFAGPKKNILQQIYAHRKEAVAAQKEMASQRRSDLAAAYSLNAAPPLTPLLARLQQAPFDVALLAEIKRASPSKGVFALDMDAPTQARNYALAGASVISVLTEPEWFKGGIDDLRAVRQALNAMANRPAILRKDFVFDEYQILEARLAGADTVLLIVKMLDLDLVEKLYKFCLSLGMEPLVEVQNEAEMKAAIKLGAKVIGVNNRNLETFEVNLGTTRRLRSLVPDGTLVCALSGINSHQDVLDCKRDGVHGILVGEALMRAPDASRLIHQLCAGKLATAGCEAGFKPLLVKICGTQTPEAAQAAVEAGADLVGIIVAPGFKRSVSHEAALAISRIVHQSDVRSKPTARLRADPQPTKLAASDYFAHSAASLSFQSETGPLLVGVFFNQPLDEVLVAQRNYLLDVVQFHGNEPIEWASLVPVPVVHKFTPGQVGLATRGFHTLPLLDPGTGSGQALDMEAVKKQLEDDAELRILLAGGLKPDNVKAVVAALGVAGERVVGVDVSSGVETDGQKDAEKMRAFIRAAKGSR